MWPDEDVLGQDPNLQQGSRMTRHEKELLDAAGPHLALLQITSDPGLMSHVEALGESATERAAAQARMAHASELEDQFNRTLVEYSKAHQEFSELTMNDIRSRNYGPFRNSVVDTGDGDYVYVSDHGVTHRYSAASWEARGKTCPSTPKQINASVLARMPVGSPMRPGQPCGVSGKNVRNEQTKETAWVDVQGTKHIYSHRSWTDKAKSCDVEVTDLSDAEYDAIPSGEPMRSVDECSQGNIDPKVWQRLQKLNDRLVHLADRLAASLSEIKVSDTGLQKKLGEYQKQIQAHVAALSRDKASSPITSGELGNARARAQSTHLLAKTRWYHYLVWIVTAVIVVALTSRALSTREPGAAASLIALVALLVIMYNVVRWLYDRLVG